MKGIPYGAVYPLWHCVTRRRASIIELCYKKESIHYATVSYEGEYPLSRCVTRRRASIIALCHKKGENTLFRCVTRKRVSINVLCHKESIKIREYPLWRNVKNKRVSIMTSSCDTAP